VFDEKIKVIDAFPKNTFTVTIYDKLKFGGNDLIIGSAAVKITDKMIKAGAKGKIPEYYPLSHVNKESLKAGGPAVAGEILLGVSFKTLPLPVVEPINVVRPWYATAGGVYVGVKKGWESAKHNERSNVVSSVANFLDDKVIAKIVTDKDSADKRFSSGLERTDVVVNEWVPYFLAKVPILGREVNMSHKVGSDENDNKDNDSNGSIIDLSMSKAKDDSIVANQGGD
jgi:hypothetical protein